MPPSNNQPSTTTQISKVELPEWVEKGSQENYQFAKDVAGRPFEQYQGQRVADTSPYTAQGNQLIQSNIGAANPYIDKSTAALDSSQTVFNNMLAKLKEADPQYAAANAMQAKASGVLDQTNPLLAESADMFRQGTGELDIQKFLNPYINEVESRAITNANEALDKRLLGVTDAAQKAGAFGGSRSAIERGVTAGEGAAGIGDLSAALRKAGFDTATATALADRDKYFKGGQGLLGTVGGMQNTATGYGNVGQGYLNTAAGIRDSASGMGAAGTGLQNASAGYLNAAGTKLAGNAQDVQSLMYAGQQDQTQAQRGLDAEMQKWGEARNYPVEQLNLRLAALGMSPYGKTETTTKTGTSEDKGPDWSTIGLGALKTLPALLALSDRNTKTDIKKLTDGDIPMYSYRYKGDPKSYPKIVGPMAQDIEKKFPSAVSKVGKHKVVNYSNLMEVLS
jgi:hypothetical protein